MISRTIPESERERNEKKKEQKKERRISREVAAGAARGPSRRYAPLKYRIAIISSTVRQRRFENITSALITFLYIDLVEEKKKVGDALQNVQITKLFSRGVSLFLRGMLFAALAYRTYCER